MHKEDARTAAMSTEQKQSLVLRLIEANVFLFFTENLFSSSLPALMAYCY